ncbi:hypothetical protein I79_004337 [Cricetulus griseus]|uniref:Uncharacterized protein n=1 Tax=Cricetulus griseus TaxID=10029 RepID=G3H2C8_CRIGR|nr:hypothetical protein I79_004337 [Cricetulus griseus]
MTVRGNCSSPWYLNPGFCMSATSPSSGTKNIKPLDQPSGLTRKLPFVSKDEGAWQIHDCQLGLKNVLDYICTCTKCIAATYNAVLF